jgi:hypothetical protein
MDHKGKELSPFTINGSTRRGKGKGCFEIVKVWQIGILPDLQDCAAGLYSVTAPLNSDNRDSLIPGR